MRKLRLAAAVSLALATPGAFALGLGDIEMRSALNQPMNAEIRLTSVDPGELEGMIVKLASPNAFRQAGIERSQVLTGLRFSVDPDGPEPVIRVTSDRPVVEPFLNFLVEVDWPQGRMVREYTVLLDPPVFMTPSASGSSALDDATSLGGRDEGALVAPAPIQRNAPLADSDGRSVERLDRLAADGGESVSLDGLLEPGAESAGGAALPGNGARPNTVPGAGSDIQVELVGGNLEVGDELPETADDAVSSDALGEAVSLDELVGTAARDSRADAAPRSTEREVTDGDTLFNIARSVADEAGSQGVSVEQTMLALLAANESAFINGNINLVRAGSILRIPSASEARRLTQAQAADEVNRQARLWQEYRDSRRGASVTRLAAAPGGSEAGDDPSAGDGRTGDTGGSLSAGAQAILDEAANTIRQERRERDQLRIVGENASGDGTDATASDSGALAAIEQRLQLAREQLASSRQEAGELDEQATQLRSTTENFDALIALRQNEIAALEARLSEARDQDAATADEAQADGSSGTAEQLAEDAASEAGTVAEQLAANGADAISDAASETAETAEAAGDALGDSADAALQAGEQGAQAAGEAASEAADSAGDALSEAGQALDGVELTDGDGDAAQIAAPAAETGEAAAPWYQTLLADPTRLAIAGVGGLALFGALGTLLWRRRSEDEEDAWLEDEDDEELLDADASAAGAGGAALRDGDAADSDDPFDKEATLDATQAAGDDPALQTSDQTASELGGLSEGALDKDDTISEVDVYLAYGLHGQAEELLTRAIDRDPNNPVYARKLLDTYRAQDNAEGFEGAAAAWQARFGGTDHPEWPAIAAMGRELRPDSPMFAAPAGADGSTGVLGGVAGAAALAGAGLAASAAHRGEAQQGAPDAADVPASGQMDVAAPAGPGDATGVGPSDSIEFDDDLAISLDDDDESGLMDQSLDPAFAFDVGDLEATGDFSSIADEIANETDAESIEFEVSRAAAPVIGAGAAGSAAAASMVGIDAPELAARAQPAEGGAEPAPNSLAGDLSLDLDELSEEMELDGTEMLEIPDLTADNDLLIDSGELPADADEVDTMIDLAKAYIDMGDRDSASSTLDEIVKSGNPDQVTEAETLLRKIS